MPVSRGSTLKVLALLLVLTGCVTSQRIMATFEAHPGAQLRPGTVQLLVQDRRPSSDLIGPEALAKDLFKASQSGRLDLTAKSPDGSQLALSNLIVSQLVWEAVRHELALVGITAIAGTQGAKARVVITVETMSVELEGHDVRAQVSLAANLDWPGVPNSFQTRGFGQSARTRLFGDQGGSQALSEALTAAINNLNFSGLNNFQ
ncbi:MAG: hypothetical protein LBR11_12750 [Deltaproteobacteria bacterium]|nr:hypothetical protein [Deltaproteobacteria bacterium]